MRSTKKSEKFINAYEWNSELPTKTFVQLGMNKFGQLEDIEDELGIDLVILFKALKNGGVYVKNSFTEDTAIKMHSFQVCGDDSGITIWSQVRLNAKDYGKTWALTKEELE